MNLERIKQILLTNRVLANNFLSLTALQATNFVLPWLVFPYLVGLFGSEVYGQVVFAQAFMYYFVVLADYGFNISATRETSLHRHDPTKLSEIFSKVITTKIYLLIAALLALTMVVCLVPTFRADWQLHLLSSPLILGQVFLSQWFFQGIEQMKFMTILNVVIKTIFVVATFWLVQVPQDYIWVNFWQGIGGICGTGVSIYLIINRFKIKFSWANTDKVKQQLYEGWPIFVSNLSTILSINSNVFILNLVSSKTQVGYFVVAQSFFLMMRAIANVFYTTLFPRVCSLVGQSYEQLVTFLKSIVKLSIVFFLPIGILCFVFAGQLTSYLDAENAIYETILLRIICFAPLIAALGIGPSQTLLANNFRKIFSTVSVIGLFVNLLLNFVLSFAYGALGTAITTLVVELFFTVALFGALHYQYPKHSVLSTLVFWK